MLIDTERRQVYDIYGKEGLEAGLEVGPHLRTRDELRRQWQQFQQQQVGGLRMTLQLVEGACAHRRCCHGMCTPLRCAAAALSSAQAVGAVDPC